MIALRPALTGALIQFLWQGAAIGLLLALMLGACRKRSANLRYALSCLALLAMLGSAAATFIWFWFRAPGADSGTVQAAIAHQAPPVALRFHLVPPPSGPDLRWIVPLWIMGAAAFLLRTLIGAGAARRLRRNAVSPASGSWQRALNRLASQMKVSAAVALLESALIEVPVVIGWLKPAILIPAGLLAGLPASQLELILIHELAHIRRRDYLVNMLQSLAEDLLFYHPAVWWVSRQIRAERENCCDDAVREFGGGREFAAALLALEQSRPTTERILVSAKGGHLMNRIKRLLEGREIPRSSGAPIVLGVLLLAAVAATMAATQTPPPFPALSKPAPQTVVMPSTPTQPPATPKRQPRVLLAQVPAPAPPRPQLNSAYESWLDQEVVYIISDEERTAFERLQTDEERDEFIRQFWLRRDPTPGTPQNEFKDEHYRRIAFANEKFGGWRTDRGQVYILFGPPDSVNEIATESPFNPGPMRVISPNDIWTYQVIEGLGRGVAFEFAKYGNDLISVRGLPVGFLRQQFQKGRLR